MFGKGNKSRKQTFFPWTPSREIFEDYQGIQKNIHMGNKIVGS